MHEPRPGYYVWRDPRDKATHVLGRIPLAQAIYEAQEANMVAERSITTKTLTERLAAGRETVADLLLKMPTEGLKPSTLTARRHYDKVIREAIGGVVCAELKTKDVADLLEAIKERGKLRWAQAIRSRLSAMCAKGMALGWMESNPVTVTEKLKPKVQRRRLTIEEFKAILEQAPKVSDWLANAMLLALVSGQDRSTVARWEKDSVVGDVAIVRRPKTGAWIAIPTALRLNVIGMSLADVIGRCNESGIDSRYLIHHYRHKGKATPGSEVKITRLTEAFFKARELAGIAGDNAPTFHEIRSLAKRLYLSQGGVDTKALLGHADERTASLYANVRGLEPVRVRIDVGDGSFEQVLNKF
jgi:integrase